jgi:hypothetical protein
MRKEIIDWDYLYKWATNLYENDINEEIRAEAYKQIDFTNKVDIMLSL